MNTICVKWTLALQFGQRGRNVEKLWGPGTRNWFSGVALGT